MPPPPAARWRRGRSPPRHLRRALLVAAVCTAALTFLLLHHQLHGPKPREQSSSSHTLAFSDDHPDVSPPATRDLEVEVAVGGGGATCATVERMGEEAAGRGSPEQASLRVRELIRRHFLLHGAARVRTLPAYEFCKQGFVLGKASEAGFGNAMYKILTAAALSIMLNRSLIIGQTRFDGTTDAIGIQFFLKNVHPGMKAVTSAFFGKPDSLHARPNTFGERMRTIISPSRAIQEAVHWALKGANPDIVLHMCMMMNRPVRARKAAVNCIKGALQICHMKGTPWVAFVSDTPSFVKEIVRHQ